MSPRRMGPRHSTGPCGGRCRERPGAAAGGSQGQRRQSQRHHTSFAGRAQWHPHRRRSADRGRRRRQRLAATGADGSDDGRARGSRRRGQRAAVAWRGCKRARTGSWRDCAHLGRRGEPSRRDQGARRAWRRRERALESADVSARRIRRREIGPTDRLAERELGGADVRGPTECHRRAQGTRGVRRQSQRHRSGQHDRFEPGDHQRPLRCGRSAARFGRGSEHRRRHRHDTALRGGRHEHLR